MGKYKAKKKKPDTPPPPQMKAGVPCLVMIGIGAVLLAILLYEVVKNAA